jgi:hypothetical protein
MGEAVVGRVLVEITQVQAANDDSAEEMVILDDVYRE